MSNIRLKHAVIRALNAAMESGALPKGCAFSGEVKDGTLCISIDGAPFNCLKDTCLTINGPASYTTTHNLCAKGEASSYTQEAQDLEASVKAIASSVIGRQMRFFVHHSSRWIRAQATAKRAGTHLGAKVGVTHTGRLARAAAELPLMPPAHS